MQKTPYNMLLTGLLCCTASFAAEKENAVAVPTAPVRMVTESSPKRYVGSVVPIEHVNIMPRVTGTLLKVNFKEGEIVQKGDLLYVLEDVTYRAAVDALKAQRDQLRASLRYATVEYERNKQLLENKAVAVSSYDKALLEIDSAKAKLKELEASLTNAENNLSYTRIHAPISGRIGISNFTEGNLITPTGEKLTDIEMIAPIYVRFSLSERVFRRDFGGREGIRDIAAIRIQLADGSRYPETASVTLIDNKINSATNTITLRATFRNQDGKLIPGGYVTVLASEKSPKPRPAVPPSALVADNEGYSVFIVGKSGKVTKRPVKTGSMSGNDQVVTAGLDGSEQIVVDGTHKIKPGMTVTPVAPDTVK